MFLDRAATPPASLRSREAQGALWRRYGFQEGNDLQTGTHNLIDTKIKLSTCNRCGGYVFACQVSGLKTAADPQPLDVDQNRAALIAGRPTYDVIRQAGRPLRLRLRTASVPTSGCDIVAGHSCGAHGMDAATFTEVPLDPPRARASGTGRQDPPCASVTRQAGRPGPVSDVTPLPIDHSWTSGPLRCDTCRNLIADQEPYAAIECGTYRWAVHDICP